jgi:hypothetical protein
LLDLIDLSQQTGACSSTDRASDYGSEGWGFESLQAHGSSQHQSLFRDSFPRASIELRHKPAFDDGSLKHVFFGGDERHCLAHTSC